MIRDETNERSNEKCKVLLENLQQSEMYIDWESASKNSNYKKKKKKKKNMN